MLKTRLMDKDDRAFILATWLKGAKFGNEYFKQIDNGPFYAFYGPLVERKLEGNLTYVSCLIDDPEVIVGFINGRPGVVDWVYVKPAFRGQGIARQLIAAFEPTVVTGYSKPGIAISKKYNLVFNPFT